MSSKQITLPKNSYKQLISSIKSTLKSGLIAAQKALEHERLKTYWSIGRSILIYAENSGGKTKLGMDLYARISNEINKELKLDLSADTILRIVLFSTDYEEFPTDTTLGFTHYQILHRIKDKTQRIALEKKAIENHLTTPQLKDEIIKLNLKEEKEIKFITALTPKRGKLFVYYVHPDKDIGGETNMYIDCGFKISIPLNGEILRNNISTQKMKKRLIKTQKTNNEYSVILYDKNKDCVDELYTYKATVLKVIDGDTIDVKINVGFGIEIKDRLRLKDINSPEINTLEGKESKTFLETYLKKCPVIIIKTSKAGMYGRWLADIFAIQKCRDANKIAAEGTYINQMLLDEGMAKRYI